MGWCKGAYELAKAIKDYKPKIQRDVEKQIIKNETISMYKEKITEVMRERIRLSQLEHDLKYFEETHGHIIFGG